MLFNLHVKNLALIDEADVYFQDGLNTLTGETGAGKSIIIGSMNLALGAKVPKDFVRNTKEEAFVELVFTIDNETQRGMLEKLGIMPEEDQVVLTRRILGGRSVARINGMSASTSLLKEAAAALLDMHGQHEHQSLLYKKKHLEILDAYAKETLGETKETVAKAYAALQQAEHALTDFAVDEEQRRREVSFLQYEIAEIEEANLVAGEDEVLEQRYRLLSNSKRIMEAVQSAHGYSGYDADGAGDLLGRACQQLASVQEYDETLASLCAQAEELDGLLNDFNRELSSYEQSLQFGDEEFYETEKRLDLLNHLKSKYGATIADVLAYLKNKKQRLADLQDYEQKLAQMQKECANCRKAYREQAEKLSGLRKQASQTLAAHICAELDELNFLDVQFEMALTPLTKETANGMDEAEFLISTNPGEAPRPLAAVASGGELSRIMLAIKVVLADKDATGTLVFDEIDTGISGRTAQKVSEKMEKIARSHQVICITHLPQIAAMADAHFLIEKAVEGGATISHIRLLAAEEEIEELSRMLGGVEITAAVRENAVEMKKLAQQAKCEKRVLH